MTERTTRRPDRQATTHYSSCRTRALERAEMCCSVEAQVSGVLVWTARIAGSRQKEQRTVDDYRVSARTDRGGIVVDLSGKMEASSPAVAIRRALAFWKVKLAKGQAVTVRCERVG